MFHKNVLNSFGSNLQTVSFRLSLPSELADRTQATVSHQRQESRLALVPPGGGLPERQRSSSALSDLVGAAAHRCSSFLAEAAVLVLVLALLDRFMLKGRMEVNWVISAFTISLLLLAASIATHFTSRRWLRHR